MPFDRKRYPSDWEAIRARILERDGHKCKFCGVPNHAYRDASDRVFSSLDALLEPPKKG